MLMMPLLTILIADTPETGVSSQVEHQVLAYCIWWCAGNAWFRHPTSASLHRQHMISAPGSTSPAPPVG
jgi:hypothetical protein